MVDLAEQLVRQLVDRRFHVGRRLLDAERRPLCPDGHFGHLVVSDRRVLLDTELQLDLRKLVQLTVELLHLFLGVPADRVADLVVLSLHLKSHAPPREPGVSP